MLFVGVDHSLSGFGLAAVAPDWGLDFRQVRRITLATGPKEGSRIARRSAIVLDAVEWIRRQTVEPFVPFSAVRVFVEGGIFQRGMSDTIRSQERLVGVLEHELAKQLGIELEMAEQRALRTLFMGRSLSGGRGAGDAAQALLRDVIRVGEDRVASWDEAELDAFLVANWALAEAGEAFVSVAPPVEPEKPARRRGRNAA